MKRIAATVSVCLCIAPSAAFAFDWSINTTQSESVEVNSNLLLRPYQAGSLGSYSTLTANAEARTPTSKFDFDGDGTYKKYWGPGIHGSTSEFLNYGFTARYQQNEKTNFDREFVQASWRQQSTALAILNDLGVSTRTSGFLDRLTTSGGIDRAPTHLDFVSLFATSTRTSYEPSSGGLPFTDTLARGSWRHSFSPIVAVNLSSEAELLDYDNVFNSRVQIYREQVGVDATLSPLLSFRGNVGPAFLVTENGVPTSPFGGAGATGAVSSSVLDWIGDAVLTYKMMKDTTLTFLASQSVGPSVVGSIFKRDTLSANLIYTINSHSSLSLSASGNRQISTTTTDYASASATYSYNFTREWLGQFTYRYQHRFASTGLNTIDPLTGIQTVSGTGPADSHSLLFVFTHSYVLVPPGSY
ncbi:hypothetical protein [Bradyrhizobium guangdongense]|uniref:Outer membrane beta-barrel protein n=1 Tax=Bradyrhizobium guangdongense TaxID=1325090 RepID=A0AA87WGD6_9BRAD|nr:hypothetical protein [Bradyrhizobium guangdongense]GGI33795.1 hypothetical protein GCM10010987_76160 [Bradyrhizobium guangdongense]